MTDAEALEDIRGYAAAGRIVFSPHARQRMHQRRISVGDVATAIAHAKSCEAAADGRWRLCGPDLDGEDTDIVCVLDEGVLVVTVF